MRILIAALVLGTSLGSSVALAQRDEERVTTYGEGAFTDDLVKGDLVRPDGDLVRTRNRSAMRSLIEIRLHFVPEMVKSVERL